MQGFVPARRGPFVSAKVPKTIFACARPCWSLVHHPESGWLGNSLRGAEPPLCSNSPRQKGRIRGGGPAAPNAGTSEKISYFANEGVWRWRAIPVPNDAHGLRRLPNLLGGAKPPLPSKSPRRTSGFENTSRAMPEAGKSNPAAISFTENCF